MKLFISYSRDDKAWVYELWRVLRDEANHDAWIDRRLVPAQDWWHTILENIETCDCCLYVMTPKSVESIYCQAELNYALALNKPVLPVMLKPCDLPSELSTRRIQYQTITDDMNLDRVLFRVSQGLNDVQIKLLRNEYPARTASRPPVPEPEKKPEQVSEVFMLAEEAASENNLSLAEKLFQQVINADPQGWGLAAADRLAEIRFERDRDRDYANIVQMANNPAHVKGARAAAKMFSQKYGTAHDPKSVLTGLLNDAVVSPPLSKVEVVAGPPVPPKITNPEPKPVESLPAKSEPAPGTRMTDSKGITMVYVPAGKFMMGSNEQDDEKPIHEQIIKAPFWLDLTPATNESYARFIAEGGYRTQAFWTPDGWQWLQDQSPALLRVVGGGKKGAKDYPTLTAPKQPRVGVTWYEAYAYCQWRGGRLPTEAEWEWAARGPENRIYPWGDEFVSEYVIYGQNSGNKTAIVGDGIRREGASWVGALDMSGNVWEWCNSCYGSYPFNANDGRESTDDGNRTRVLRGGSWFNDSTVLRAANRLRLAPGNENFDLGFRSVRSS